jgi:hypothetical protein
MVGYNGQWYEVRFTDGDGTEHVMGWTNSADGGGLVESINAHPVWHDPRVVDLREVNDGGKRREAVRGS